DVTLVRNGNDVTIVIAESAAGAGDGGSVLLKNNLDDYYYQGVEKITFANGTTWTRAVLRAMLVNYAGTSGNDTITGFNVADVITAGAGNDTITAGDGNDTLDGEAGNDILDGGSGDDTHIGGEGDDLLIGNVGADTFDGGNGVDTLDFTYYTANHSINLDTGLVTFSDGTTEQILNIENAIGGAGNNVMQGSSANNRLEGRDGNDALSGGAGNDVLNGGNGTDSHFGGDGDDLLIGNVGADTFDGGNGVDTLDFTYYTANHIIDLAANRVIFSDGTFEEALNIENAIAGSGNNELRGSSANNRLDGGSGNDMLTGGQGSDTFVFAANFGKDTISDFQVGAASDDIIDLKSNVFADFASVLAAATQVGTDTLITYDANNSILLKNVALANLHQDDFRFTAAT
ncbi:Hemolysin-type calcium-binding repeat-containing protein, partial [Rhizobium mongolense subsp. loessense]